MSGGRGQSVMRWFAALSPLVLVACGSTAHQIPQSHVEAPVASIGAAEQQGVAGVPDANRRLDRAKQELATAKRAASQGDTRKADLLYLRADADARMAMAIAQDLGAVADTQRIDRQAQEVQNEVRSCAQASGTSQGGEGKQP